MSHHQVGLPCLAHARDSLGQDNMIELTMMLREGFNKKIKSFGILVISLCAVLQFNIILPLSGQVLS